MTMPLLAITTGEPAGIGPDICLSLCADGMAARLVFLGDPELLAARAAQLRLGIRISELESYAAATAQEPGCMQVLPFRLQHEVTPGTLDPANARYVVSLLHQAGVAALERRADAIVTAPVQKSVITASGHAFSGHTEFFAELCHAPLPVMLLVRDSLRVALVTTHLPLRAVPDAITARRVERTLAVLDHDLRLRFGIVNPRILVLGLNPHAGESGTLGMEEQTIIAPALVQAHSLGIDAVGPAAGDTAFTPDSLKGIDAVLAMYHDQGLAPLKAHGFGEIVNVTLGLPIIRTSVDHGTALGLAGSGQARADSLRAAVRMAVQFARQQPPP